MLFDGGVGGVEYYTGIQLCRRSRFYRRDADGYYYIPEVETEERIFNAVKRRWERDVGKGNVDERKLRRAIRLFNTDGDGLKRVVFLPTGKTHLVPIEDIMLDGLKSGDINGYPVEGEPRG